ncbi:proton-conducting transporter membrane subunit [Streptomyces sp. NPDC094438]|uniref:proton-conducting transporter transmembrane domain-containing protein n=1 Tax=Streptomyces sp. NPDC094438 TaxID=3366061 RepID=UPI0037FAB523
MSALGCVAVVGQVAVVGAGAPLRTGWMRQVRARLEGRAGAGVLQPWRDTRKLLRKEPITAVGTGPAFRLAPALLVATTTVAAALVHIAGHGLAKATAFCASGHLLQLTATSRIGRVRGLLTQAPLLGGAFGLSIVALLAFPPFSLFASEICIARAGFTTGMGWPVILAFVLVLVAFAALALRTAHMLLGSDHTGRTSRPGPSALWPLGLALAACALLGYHLGPLADLLTSAAHTIEGP